MNQNQARVRVLQLAAQDLEAHVGSGSELIYCEPHSRDDATRPESCKDCDRIGVAWTDLIEGLRRRAGGR